MNWFDLVSALGPYFLRGQPPPTIAGVHYDSRQVKNGDLFVALPGSRRNGAHFALEAERRGAAAVLAEEPIPALNAPLLIVPDARAAMARAAAAFFGFPSRRLKVIGITGTKGKTTVAYVFDSILRAAGVKTALFTTISNVVAGIARDATLTTGESPDLQRGLRAAADAGATHALVEVSSHGLALKRVEELDFAAAVFTNLSHDHLDFHGDLETYFQTKRRLFLSVKAGGVRVASADDPYGARLATEGGVLTFGFSPRADYRVKLSRAGWDGADFTLTAPDGEDIPIKSPLPMKFNVLNAAAAATAAHALGFPPAAITEGVARAPAVPGRLEVINLARQIRVVVDYAHSPDSMDKALAAVSELKPTRLIVVFGCTGDRDRAKRPVMGEIAARYADFVVVTDDDPYYEDEGAIAAEVAAGIEPTGVPYEIILDRAAAIRAALARAKDAAGAVVAVLGKGHEKVMKVRDGTVPFADVTAVTAAAVQFDLIAHDR